MMKKIILSLIAIAAVATTPIVAQTSDSVKSSGLGSMSYLTVGIHCGPGGLMMNGSIAAPSRMGVDLGLNIDYTFFLNRAFGFNTGLGFNWLNSGLSTSKMNSTFMGRTPVNSTLAQWSSTAHFICSTASVEETYNSFWLEVPLRIAIQAGRFIANLGFKVAMPVQMKANYNIGETTVSIDYLPGTGTQLDSPMPMANYTARSGQYDLYGNAYQDKVQMLFVMTSIELGWHVAFTSRNSLALTAYFDYSLNEADLHNDNHPNLISMGGDDFVYNGALRTTLIQSLCYFKAGFKLQYNFGLGHSSAGRYPKKSRHVVPDLSLSPAVPSTNAQREDPMDVADRVTLAQFEAETKAAQQVAEAMAARDAAEAKAAQEVAEAKAAQEAAEAKAAKQIAEAKAAQEAAEAQAERDAAEAQAAQQAAEAKAAKAKAAKENAAKGKVESAQKQAEPKTAEKIAQSQVGRSNQVEGLAFKVQFLSADDQLQPGDPKLKGITDYESYEWLGCNRYTQGSFATLGEAVVLQDRLRRYGFADAFVVAFYQGRRITLLEARKLLGE